MPPQPAESLCRLYYRPLREGIGEGDAPPWTVEEYAGDDFGALRDAPVKDAVADLARRGGPWLAFTTHAHVVEFRTGEYILRGGAAEPLYRTRGIAGHSEPWSREWPVAWWEYRGRTGVDLLRVDPLHPAWRGLACVAWVRLLLQLAPHRSVMDSEAAERTLDDWVRNLDTWEAEFRAVIDTGLPSEAAVDTRWKVDRFTDVVFTIDRNVRDDPRVGTSSGRSAWCKAWDEASAQTVRRVVGDRWFLAIADRLALVALAKSGLTPG